MARILVVDDEPTVRALVRDVLEEEGYDVQVAADGFSALREVQANRPDCVVLDVMMPGLDGHQVLRRLRAEDAGGDRLPVVMLTAAADDEHAWQAWREGVDYFLPKPFDALALLRFLDHLFDAPSRLPG